MLAFYAKCKQNKKIYKDVRSLLRHRFFFWSGKMRLLSKVGVENLLALVPMPGASNSTFSC